MGRLLPNYYDVAEALLYEAKYEWCNESLFERPELPIAKYPFPASFSWAAVCSVALDDMLIVSRFEHMRAPLII